MYVCMAPYTHVNVSDCICIVPYTNVNVLVSICIMHVYMYVCIVPYTNVNVSGLRVHTWLTIHSCTYALDSIV